MGFLKDKHDVEEKGLDPTVPHSKVGLDGRLIAANVSPNLPTANEAEPVSSTEKATNEKAVSVQKKKAVTLKSNKQGEENAVKQDSNDSDMLSEVHKELPVETKNKPKQTRKRKTPTKKRTKAKKATSTRKKTSTRRKIKKEET